ncbi:MAG TPA: cation diffusion facilitator family transporter [Planctomycetota bacterium]|nr:cation diffusion facilitator family transporter [Planctomycetota bacterium]
MSEPSFVRQRIRAAALSLAVGVVMLVGKSFAYWLTGSAGILSDALESVVHVIATGFAFYSVLLSARPPNPKFPYGYGKIEYFSAGLEGGLITVAAAAILFEATLSLIHGPKLQSLDLGVLIVGSLGLTNLALGWFLIRTGRKTNSIILVADGQHVLTDAYTSLGVVAALFVVRMTGWMLLDPIIAIVVALQILWTAGKILREAFFGLMNRSDTEFLEKVNTALIAARPPEWIEIHRLRSFPNASDAHQIDLHLTVPRYWSVEAAHAAEHQLEETLQTQVEPAITCLIHVDPCRPSHCSVCRHGACAVRSTPLETPASWTLEAMTGGPLFPPPVHSHPESQAI